MSDLLTEINKMKVAMKDTMKPGYRLYLYYHGGGPLKVKGYTRRYEDEMRARTEMAYYQTAPSAWAAWRREDRHDMDMRAGWFIVETREAETNEHGEVHP